MITEDRGNIILSPCDAIVNTVNCVGVMGKGLALQFKTAFPANYHAYKNACNMYQVKPGKCFVFNTQGIKPRFIINFPTKRHWKDNSLLEDINSGLDDLVYQIGKNGILSIAIPPLGCGLGGLSWSVVKPIIVNKLKDIPVDVVLFCPKQ